MDDIAARVGVSKPIIYRHFKSKKELLEVLLNRDLTPDFLQTIPMIREYAGPLKQLLQVLIARIDPTLPSRQATIPMFRLILSDGYRVPEFAKNFHRTSIQPISDALAEVFVRAMTDGKMRKANAKFAARELFAPYMHMMVTLTLTGREQFGPWQAREYLNHTLESFIRSYEIAD
jgi:AcrR family transcriptional regulator